MDHSKHSNRMKSSVDPCSGNLTDREYLEHMIPHHQVAIDMSNMLSPVTTNPTMLHLCRDITRKQSYEIWEMTIMEQKLADGFFYPKKGAHSYPMTKLEYHNPIESKSKGEKCNPLFFKPNDHSKHMDGMKMDMVNDYLSTVQDHSKHMMNMEITDKSYLEHMIPHHQVAVDMSKRLLMYTNHSYLIDFCNKLIVDQQYEIFYMNSLLKNSYNYQSELIM